ncbi:MAG: hypothetical protein LBH00_07910 [Planctomycetaceae bacterium]|jgi:hypothetical protein|nr:hypothetical protein [Planctomycetaceae bacterium]
MDKNTLDDIQKVHANSTIPIKKKKYFNRELSPKRVVTEHVNTKIKAFKMMSYLYRNRRRIHLLRTTLTGGIINTETQI